MKVDLTHRTSLINYDAEDELFGKEGTFRMNATRIIRLVNFIDSYTANNLKKSKLKIKYFKQCSITMNILASNSFDSVAFEAGGLYPLYRRNPKIGKDVVKAFGNDVYRLLKNIRKLEKNLDEEKYTEVVNADMNTCTVYLAYTLMHFLFSAVNNDAEEEDIKYERAIAEWKLSNLQRASADVCHAMEYALKKFDHHAGIKVEL